jgi:hypothetical protein
MTGKRFAVTDYGFQWGPLEVTRDASTPTHVMLRVATIAGREIEIVVSEQGRSMTVFAQQGMNDEERLVVNQKPRASTLAMRSEDRADAVSAGS